MPEQIRMPNVITKKLTNVLGTTPAIPFHDYAGAHLAIPASYVSTTINVFVSDAEAGTYQQLVDTDGSDVALVVTASKTYDLPIAIFAAHWAKFVTNADDTTRTVTFLQKS